MQDSNKNKSKELVICLLVNALQYKMFAKLLLGVCIYITSTSAESGFMYPHVLSSLDKKKGCKYSSICTQSQDSTK